MYSEYIGTSTIASNQRSQKRKDSIMKTVTYCFTNTNKPYQNTKAGLILSRMHSGVDPVEKKYAKKTRSQPLQELLNTYTLDQRSPSK